MQTKQTAEFARWFGELREERARTAIAVRIARVEAGLFGDVKYFDGIGELRIDVGPGYRVYFVRREAEWIILMNGGDKQSQRRDIKRAKQMAAMI